MIPKILGIVSVLVLHEATGASYSKVFVQSGPDIVPVEYVNYGAPVVTQPKIARLTATPVGSVVSVPSVSSVIPPCVSPCIVGQNVAPVSSLPNAKFITYNAAPNVPVVVAPKDNGYEYSYVVYDENTGDRKALREFSDGAVVRGEYSFVEPDGYVREVQYRADDLTGFNVIVKKILPESVGGEKKEPPPCKDVKSEALKEEPAPVAEAPINHDSPDHECHDHDGDGNEDHESKDHVELTEPVNVAAEEQTHEELNEAPPTEETVSTLEPENAPVEATVEAEAAPEPAPEAEKEPEKPEEPAPEAQEETHEAIVVPDEATPAVVVPSLPIPVPDIPASNLVVSYEDIIRCVQSKAQTQQGLNISPLTYIILPAANRPC